MIDFHQPPRDEDCIHFCPASVPGIARVQQDVGRMAAVKRHGGLGACYRGPVFELPEALVGLYEEVDEALERFAAEARDAARRAAKKREA